MATTPLPLPWCWASVLQGHAYSGCPRRPEPEHLGPIPTHRQWRVWWECLHLRHGQHYGSGFPPREPAPSSPQVGMGHTAQGSTGHPSTPRPQPPSPPPPQLDRWAASQYWAPHEPLPPSSSSHGSSWNGPGWGSAEKDGSRLHSGGRSSLSRLRASCPGFQSPPGTWGDAPRAETGPLGARPLPAQPEKPSLQLDTGPPVSPGTPLLCPSSPSACALQVPGRSPELPRG